MMDSPIWFFVALGLLGWVIYQKWQIGELKKDKEQLAAALRFAAKRMKDDVVTTTTDAGWGQRPGWMK